MPKLHGFSWFRVQGGYELLPAEAPKPNTANLSLVESSTRGPQIIPIGRDVVQYAPLDAFEALYGIFSKICDGEGALDFVKKFGPLTGLDGDDVESIVRQARAMREILELGEPSKIAEKFAGLQLAPLRVTLIWNQAGQKFNFDFSPRHLLEALWFQLAQTLAGGCEIHTCRHCGEWFPTGAGTPRRLDAEFCCRAHKVAWHSHSRTPSPGKPRVKPRKQAGKAKIRLSKKKPR